MCHPDRSLITNRNVENVARRVSLDMVVVIAEKRDRTPSSSKAPPLLTRPGGEPAARAVLST
jgi:hypothetical protein